MSVSTRDEEETKFSYKSSLWRQCSSHVDKDRLEASWDALLIPGMTQVNNDMIIDPASPGQQ